MLQVWNPSKLSYQEVQEYLEAGRHYMPRKMPFSEDILLNWLAYHNYDKLVALQNLMKYF